MNYPNGVKKADIIKIDNTISHKNRGMTLESEINSSNEYYRNIEKAYIYKKPTPIKIAKVDYPSRKEAIIKEAYFTIPSTTDYNGLYNGKYIDFEAKETNNLSFPLANIHKHQIKHIINIFNNGGICFIIVRFNKKNITYLLTAKDFISFIENNTRKSIPLEFFEKNAYKIELKYTPRLDYIKIIDKIMEVSK